MRCLLLFLACSALVYSEKRGPPGMAPPNLEALHQSLIEMIATPRPIGSPKKRVFVTTSTTETPTTTTEVVTEKVSLPIGAEDDALTPAQIKQIWKKVGMDGKAFGVRTRSVDESSIIHNIDGLNPALPAFAFNEDETSSNETESAFKDISVERETTSTVITEQTTTDASSPVPTSSITTTKSTLSEDEIKALSLKPFKVGKNWVPVHLFFDRTSMGLRRKKHPSVDSASSTSMTASSTTSTTTENETESTTEFVSTTTTTSFEPSTEDITTTMATVTSSESTSELPQTKTSEETTPVPKNVLPLFKVTTKGPRTDDFLVPLPLVTPELNKDEMALNSFKFSERTTLAPMPTRKSKLPKHTVLPELLAMPDPRTLSALPALSVTVPTAVANNKTEELTTSPSSKRLSKLRRRPFGDSKPRKPLKHKKTPVLPSVDGTTGKLSTTKLNSLPKASAVRQLSIDGSARTPLSERFDRHSKKSRPVASGSSIQQTKFNTDTKNQTPSQQSKIVRANNIADAEESFAKSLLDTEKMLIDGLKQMKMKNKKRVKKHRKRQNQRTQSAGKTVTVPSKELSERIAVVAHSTHDGSVDRPQGVELKRQQPTTGRVFERDLARKTVDRDV